MIPETRRTRIRRIQNNTLHKTGVFIYTQLVVGGVGVLSTFVLSEALVGPVDPDNERHRPLDVDEQPI